MIPPLQGPRSKYTDELWAQHKARRAAAAGIFLKEGIDIIDVTPYILEEKTKIDFKLWHTRIWDQIKSKFPLPEKVKAVEFKEGEFIDDANSRDEPALENETAEADSEI